MTITTLQTFYTTSVHETRCIFLFLDTHEILVRSIAIKLLNYCFPLSFVSTGVDAEAEIKILTVEETMETVLKRYHTFSHYAFKN